MSNPKILFQLSGSIACFKACSVISALVKKGCEVQVVASQAALEFVGLATLEGLSGRPVVTSTFQPGEYMAHIRLMNWADLVILCPATANMIGKMATGVGDDLISTLFLAFDFKKPYLVAPAMNTKMYLHPSTQASIQKLRSWGVDVLEAASGVLACGEEGLGRLLEPDAILAEIEKRLPELKSDASTGLKILVTSGGTREFIDGVRAITNVSTGRTGAFLANYFASRGHKVSFLYASESARPELPVHEISYVSFRDLQLSIENLLKNNHYDAVVHAAAVSDFGVELVELDGTLLPASEESKLSSEGELTVKLKKNPKLVDQIKKISQNRNIVLVAFKLLVKASEEEVQSAVEKLFAATAADFIVENDILELGRGRHVAHIFDCERSVASGDGPKLIRRVEDKPNLAIELEKLIVQKAQLPGKIKQELSSSKTEMKGLK